MVVLGLKKLYFPPTINPKKHFQILGIYRNILYCTKKLPDGNVNFSLKIKIGFKRKN